MYALERNGGLVQHVQFKGDGLYRDYDIVVMTFTKLKEAEEIAESLNATVVPYSE